MIDLDRFFSSRRGVILAGEIPFFRQEETAGTILSLSQRTGWPLFVDALSGLKGHAGVIRHADMILHHPPGESPERLLHIGESYVSKRVSLWVRSLRGDDYLQVRHSGRCRDPFFQDPRLITRPLEEFARDVPEGEGWSEAWMAADRQAEALCVGEIDSLLSEPSVARITARRAVQAGGLFVGNSMPIRDFDAFASPEGPLRVLGNRGASGIDGNIATAAGAAHRLDRPLVALMGDLTALHDLNSLALLRVAPVILVIVNNGGGGIFRFLSLPVPENDLRTYWETPHAMDFRSACAQFGLPWQRAVTPGELDALLRDRIAEGSSAVIEVATDRSENRDFHDSLAAKVRALPLWDSPR
jgi:2-succinyl-5-enolpyruvyl-6-hydroxy-3-cyclohexene-1-carboxylate synthase